MHSPTQYFQNALAYFSTTVSYTRKMFINLAPGQQDVDLGVEVPVSNLETALLDLVNLDLLAVNLDPINIIITHSD